MKTIIKKSTGEFAVLHDRLWSTSLISEIYSDESSLEALKEYNKKYWHVDIDIEDYKMVEIELKIKT